MKNRGTYLYVCEEREDGEHGDGESADSQATLCAYANEERGHAKKPATSNSCTGHITCRIPSR